MITTPYAAPRVHADVAASARAQAGMRAVAPVAAQVLGASSVSGTTALGRTNGTTNGSTSVSTDWGPPS